MAETFEVHFESELSVKDAEKVRQTLQKSLKKWFANGHDIAVRQK